MRFKDVTCWRCHGRGDVLDADPELRALGMRVDCPACGGRGRLTPGPAPLWFKAAIACMVVFVGWLWLDFAVNWRWVLRWLTGAASVALMVAAVGCGEPPAGSDLSRMDVFGVWSDVFRSEDPPGLLLVADEPMHHHDSTVAYLTPGVTADEMAHALTHVWIERTALVVENADWADGDPDHRQSVWAANQPGPHVIERAAATYLRANLGQPPAP